MTQLQLELGPSGPQERFTSEQRLAIERREGDLLLDAGAGSGKTTVLVERFVRSVSEDQLEVGRILAITFTEKAASELRERIRRRLREVGLEQAARDTESAWISTIHGFCARVVRAHALLVGLDPEFTVLDAPDASRLTAQAFELALAAVARTDGGADLIATYGPARLSSAIVALHDELRSQGLAEPSLPPGPPAGGSAAEQLDAVRRSALAALRELGTVDKPGQRVSEAIALLESVDGALAAGVPWPGELDRLQLRERANALRTEACDAYRAALASLRAISESVHAGATREALDVLLREFSGRYAALKRSRSVLDFEDLELFARRLLADPSVGARYRERFARVMVDEMQDTNRVQLELIDRVAAGRLFMVGDAQQSIYAFRHADVELFEARGRELEAAGARASLQTNFRSLPDLLAAINAGFERELGDRFRALIPGRSAQPGTRRAPVELLLVDRAADFADEEEDAGAVAPWRLAEARALAARVARLLADGTDPGEIVVLTRATTDLAAYERALAEAGVPTYVIGGRGYWEHPQVIELTSYLRALANPLDEEAWFTTLLSPLCGLSLDGLVMLAAGAREELSDGDRRLLDDFESWFAAERAAGAWTGAEELIERALRRRAYELLTAGRPDARRRLANIHKLMRLARGWEASHGTDLRGFVDLLSERAAGDEREGEAPVENEALDAVRLMTIHRSKGLEFPVVCVADLGRQSTMRGAPIVRVGRDGDRLGLRIGRPGTAGLVEAFDYAELKAEQLAAESAEERRLFYVAMTRAQDRLILSGAAQLYDWEAKNRRAPIGWIGSALAPEIGSRLAEGRFTTALGVEVTVISDDSEPVRVPMAPQQAQSGGEGTFRARPVPHAETAPSPMSPATLSYSSITSYEHCGYRFYVQQLLGLPTVDTVLPTAPAGPAGERPPGLTGAARGIAIHELLRDLDFDRAAADAPPGPDDLPAELAAPLNAFRASATATRIAAAAELRREQPFAFLHDGQLLITGVFDVLARERLSDGSGSERLLVVDYKSDQLDDRDDPEQIAEQRYATQRTVYALAALHTVGSGAVTEVEVVHLFLERPDRPVSRTYRRADLPALEHALSAKVAGLRAGDYPVTDSPWRGVCQGCPAAGGLCPHPLELTRRSQLR